MAKTIKEPASPKTLERKFGQAMRQMIERMERQFRNEAIKGLNKSTIKKFEDSAMGEHEAALLSRYQFSDAQVGNYARVFLKLANRVRRKLVRRFDNERLDKLSDNVLNSVDKQSKQKFYNQLSGAIGVDPVQLMRKEGLTPQMNALKLETLQWVKKLRDETLEKFTNDTLHAMAEGKSVEEILQQYDELAEQRRNHAEFLARNQIQNYNSLSTKLRAQKAGVRRARWSTSDDDRVRPSHADRDGKVFDLDKGLYSSIDGKYLMTGVDYNCRCTSELIIEDEEE